MQPLAIISICFAILYVADSTLAASHGNSTTDFHQVTLRNVMNSATNSQCLRGHCVPVDREAPGNKSGRSLLLDQSSSATAVDGLVSEGARRLVPAENCDDALAQLYDIQANSLGFLGDSSRKKISNIAFLKTHKTGSSTLGGIFFRFAARQKLRLYSTPGVHLLEVPLQRMPVGSRSPFHMSLQHITGDGMYKGAFANVVDYFRFVVRDPVLVSVLREPVSHYLSYFTYYIAPDLYIKEKRAAGNATTEGFWDPATAASKGMALGEGALHMWVAQRRLLNPLAAEFGVYTVERAHAFIQRYILDPDSPLFFLLVLEKFDESLVVLRWLLNWDLFDMSYSKLLDSSRDRVRYDKRALPPMPTLDQLPASLVDAIQRATVLDRMIYDAAVVRLEGQLQRLAAKGYTADQFKAELSAMGVIQRTLASACALPSSTSESTELSAGGDAGDSSEDTGAHDSCGRLRSFCRWYRCIGKTEMACDMFENFVDDEGTIINAKTLLLENGGSH